MPPTRLQSSQCKAWKNFRSHDLLVIRKGSYSVLPYFKLLPLVVFISSPLCSSKAQQSNSVSCLCFATRMHIYTNYHSLPLAFCMNFTWTLSNFTWANYVSYATAWTQNLRTIWFKRRYKLKQLLVNGSGYSSLRAPLYTLQVVLPGFQRVRSGSPPVQWP